MRYALISAGVLFALLVVAFTMLNSQEITPEVLARRCAESRPAWHGYQEDIKEIGARPVAQWRGEPTKLTVSSGAVHLIFVLDAPWDRWDAALPVLLKTPEGQVFQNTSYVRDGAVCTYVFNRASDQGISLPPWLDVQFPHTKQRLHLDAQGIWRSATNSTGPTP